MGMRSDDETPGKRMRQTQGEDERRGRLKILSASQTEAALTYTTDQDRRRSHKQWILPEDDESQSSEEQEEDGSGNSPPTFAGATASSSRMPAPHSVGTNKSEPSPPEPDAAKDEKEKGEGEKGEGKKGEREKTKMEKENEKGTLSFKHREHEKCDEETQDDREKLEADIERDSGVENPFDLLPWNAREGLPHPWRNVSTKLAEWLHKVVLTAPGNPRRVRRLISDAIGKRDFVTKSSLCARDMEEAMRLGEWENGREYERRQSAAAAAAADGNQPGAHPSSAPPPANGSPADTEAPPADTQPSTAPRSADTPTRAAPQKATDAFDGSKLSDALPQAAADVTDGRDDAEERGAAGDQRAGIHPEARRPQAAAGEDADEEMVSPGTRARNGRHQAPPFEEVHIMPAFEPRPFFPAGQPFMDHDPDTAPPRNGRELQPYDPPSQRPQPPPQQPPPQAEPDAGFAPRPGPDAPWWERQVERASFTRRASNGGVTESVEIERTFERGYPPPRGGAP